MINTRAAMTNDTNRVSTGTSIDLIEAQNTHAIIDVQAQGSATIYQSTILAVDPSSRQIIIDELFPAGFAGMRGLPITITLRLAGNRRACLKTQLLERHSLGGNTRYCVAMPADCTYTQRRSAYRFRLNPQAAAYAEFLVPGNFFCSGSISDISLSGMRLILNHRVQLRTGAALDNITFGFAGEQFSCQASVRNIHTDAHGIDIIGVEFKDMPRPQQRVLEKILMQFHRNLAREKARNGFASKAVLH